MKMKKGMGLICLALWMMACDPATERHPRYEAAKVGGADVATAETAAPVAVATPAGKAGVVSGVAVLSDAAKKRVQPGQVVFVMVKSKNGETMAVKRLVADAWPLSFEVGPEDSMQGQPLDGELTLIVRVDADGLAGPATPDDVEAKVAAVHLGEAVQITISQ